MLKVEVCIGSACHLKGSYNVISVFQEQIEALKLGDEVELAAVFCLSHCTDAVSVRVGGGAVQSVSPAAARAFFETEILPKISA